MLSNLGSSPEELSGALASLVRALPRDVLLKLIALLMERLSRRSRDSLTFALCLRRSAYEGRAEKDREALLDCVRHLAPEEQRAVTLAVLDVVALPEHGPWRS